MSNYCMSLACMLTSLAYLTRKSEQYCKQSARIGQNVTLQCNTFEPEDVDWHFYRNYLNSTVENTEIIYRGGHVQEDFKRCSAFMRTANEFILAIYNVSLNDNGLYQCIERRGIGRKHDIVLTVHNDFGHNDNYGNLTTSDENIVEQSKCETTSISFIIAAIVSIGVPTNMVIAVLVILCRYRQRKNNKSRTGIDAERTRDGDVQEFTPLVPVAIETIFNLPVELLPFELKESLLFNCFTVHMRKDLVSMEQMDLVSVFINLQSVCKNWWHILTNRRRRVCTLCKKICRPFRLHPRLTYSKTGLPGPCSVAVINNRVYVSSPHSPHILGFDINQPNYTDGSTGIELKDVMASNQGMQYYDYATYSETGRPNHFNTKDIVANTTETALYVTDESIGTRKIMLGNATNGHNVEELPIESPGKSLSLTPDNDLLVVKENKLVIFSPDGNEKRHILLPEQMIPTHAIAAIASDFVCNTFFVGHTSKSSGSDSCEDNAFYEVSEISANGKVQRSFGSDQGAGFVSLNEPPYLARVSGKHILVTDSGNSRILILVRKEGELKLERVLLTLSDGRKPHQMCYVEETGFLVVGTDDGSINVYDIMQNYYTRCSRETSAQMNGITRSC